MREAAWLLGYVALAVWWTWPLATVFSTRIAGGHGPLSIGDNLQFAWNFDHVARSWDAGRSAFTDSNLFFPHEASLALHTMQWHHSALAYVAWKVAPGVPLPAVCNALLLATLCLNATATRLLCRHVLWRVGQRSDLAAWAIGAAAAFGPISAARSEGHWNLLAWGYLPLLMLALLHLDEALAHDDAPRPKYLRRALACSAAAACVALGGWCDVQYVLFAVSWAGVFFVVSRHPRGLARAAWWGGAFAAGAAMLLPVVLTMAAASKGAPKMGIDRAWALDIANLVSPSPWHPVLGRFAFVDVGADGIEWVVAPGIVLLILGAWGWRCSPRAARPWAWSAVALWILACGPGLQVVGRPIVSPFAPSPEPIAATAPGAPELDAREESWKRAVTMPFWLVREAVRPLKSFRVPARFSIPALACWSVCAALGLVALGQNAQKLPALQVLVGAALLFECWRAPIPSFDARVPKWAAVLRDARGASGVVPAPMAFNNWRHSWDMWGQTIHRKPLFAAYLSRAPRGLEADPVRRTALWAALQSYTKSAGAEEKLIPFGPLPSPEQAARELELWRSDGARFLLWNRRVAREEDAAALRQFLQRSGRAKLVSEDKEALLWEIAPARGTLRRP